MCRGGRWSSLSAVVFGAIVLDASLWPAVGDKSSPASATENFSLQLAPAAFPQSRSRAWTAEDFPDWHLDPERCVVGSPYVSPSKDPTGALTFCDPEGLLNSSHKFKRDWPLFTQVLQAFDDQLGPKLYGEHWGVHLGVALLSESHGPLPVFAEALAKKWGLNEKRSVLIVLCADCPPAVALAGSFRAAGELTSSKAESIEREAAGFVEDGQFVFAVQTAVRQVVMEVAGTHLRDEAYSGIEIPQRMLAAWKSKYQSFEIWENSCGERRCLELLLDEVRQISDRYEAYYHEAMVYPALNALGPNLGKRVLVLGGGDGGIATYALKYSSVERVVVVELDDEVVNTSKAWFPASAAGYEDPRCELVLVDALAWAQAQADAKNSGENQQAYDVIIIDFTDEPVEGAWNTKFFRSLKTLLSPHGVLVQNMGTLTTNDLKKLFRLHQEQFAKVHPMNTFCPDYLAPYILAISTDSADVLSMHREFWEQQKIVPKYYSAELHEHLFVMPANTLNVLQMPVPLSAESPRALQDLLDAKMVEVDVESEDFDRRVYKVDSHYNTILVMQQEDCAGMFESVKEACNVLKVNSDYLIGPSSFYVHEPTVYPAMNILGAQAQRVLILGGGSGGLARLVLQFPSVKQLTIVEIDEEIVKAVKSKGYFLSYKAALEDPRVTVVVADALEWLVNDGAGETFDVIFLDIADEQWRPAQTATRVPRIRRFYETLKMHLSPHGLLVQEIGSLATVKAARQLVNLHRSAGFASTWVLNFARLPDNVESTTREYPLDAIIRRPPRLLALSARSPLEDPLSVDWTAWGKLGLQTQYYHASMHHALFVLPSELQRYLEAPPPSRREQTGRLAAWHGGEL